MDYWRAFHETQPNPKAFPVGREKFSYDHLFQRDWKTCITSKVLQDESDHSGRKIMCWQFYVLKVQREDLKYCNSHAAHVTWVLGIFHFLLHNNHSIVVMKLQL